MIILKSRKEQFEQNMIDTYCAIAVDFAFPLPTFGFGAVFSFTALVVLDFLEACFEQGDEFGYRIFARALSLTSGSSASLSGALMSYAINAKAS